MSTRNHPDPQASRERGRALAAVRAGDQTELVAVVISAKRATLLRAHRFRLRPDDLEECFAQAALELVVGARKGARFASRVHVARTLEQRFLSRVYDRRRAIEGRSAAQAELERALRAGLLDVAGGEVADPVADVARLAALRGELALLPVLARELTADQRLVLACQIALQMECAEFCERFGWTREKYRKVAQRGRARLRALADRD